MVNPLISIIIPVYKAELYLPCCLESIIAQTYRELEVILVDDGSPDHCPEICDDYAKRDTRINVIHKENGGVSSARNAGLESANGEYVCFVDSDDRVPQNGIALLYEAISRTDCQYAAGVCQIDGQKKNKNTIERQKIIYFQENPEELLEYLTRPGSYSPYAKIYRMDIIRNNGIRFEPTLKCAEDALMIRQYMRYCNRICLIPAVVYSYNAENENSLSKKGYPDYALYYAEKMKALEELANVLPLNAKQRMLFLAERAAHGIDVCINHYFNNFHDSNTQRDMLKNTVTILYPWLSMMPVTGRHIYYAEWKKYAEKSSSVNLFYSAVRRKHRINTINKNVKRLCRNFFK